MKINPLTVKRISPMLVWFAVILLIILAGISGFMIIEGLRFFDALYMTVITITTIGYMEVKPLSEAGRVFNIVFIITSFATFTYALASLTRYVASGEMQSYFKNKKLMSSLEKLTGHVIVCGFGRNGQEAAQTLKAHKVPFVVIDYKERNIDEYLNSDPDLLYLKGDATDDALLTKAGIERARSIVCTLPTDADNVFIVLSARSLNQSLQIISRASESSSVHKLKKAGADNVIMPDKIGGKHMATLVSKPDVVEFIEYLSGEEGESINIESVDYEKLPPEIRDVTLKEVMDWKKTGVNCLGVKNADGKFLINPPDDIIVCKGMKVLVLGMRNQIHQMKGNVDSSATVME